MNATLPKMTDVSATKSVIAIRKTLPAAGHDFLLEVAFDLNLGITILYGASGAGKTTLLDCIAGLTSPDSGRVVVDNCVFFDRERGVDLPAQRRRVGYVFQDLALFPHISAEGNVAYGISKIEPKERAARTQAILESFRIAHVRQRKPGEISGGEQQRVALARALVADPGVLLLDEPLAGLDAAVKSKIIDDLREWNRTHRVPILYVTHSREEVFALGERVLVLEQGRIVAQGTPQEVMTAPRRETVAQLAGFENIFALTVIAAHEDRGTMTCRIGGSHLELETPLVRAAMPGSELRLGIRAGDILLATVQPQGLSARNVIPGRIVSLEQRDVTVVARVDCGAAVEVHLTLAGRDALGLRAGCEVWLIVKTYSCHVMGGIRTGL